MTETVDVVAVDWSGAQVGAADRIWLGHVRQGRLVELRNGLDRRQTINHLIDLRERCPDGLVVGLDFAFSVPSWFLPECGAATVFELWNIVEAQGEQWLVACNPPWWGRPGRRRPELPEHFRQCERTAVTGGIGAKSVFQIGGAGSVGTGSLRGMPYLTQLRRAGFGIWPFDPPSPWTVVEIYPRLLTGPVHKRNRPDRVAYLAESGWTMSRSFARAAAGSEDAFDAAISALVMEYHRHELAALTQTSDAQIRLEGDIFVPLTSQCERSEGTI